MKTRHWLNKLPAKTCKMFPLLGGALDFALRCSLVRFARQISAVPDLHRRFQQWVRDGTLRKLLETLAADLYSRGRLDLSECFIDGTFVVAKKGASELEKPSGEGVRYFV